MYDHNDLIGDKSLSVNQLDEFLELIKTSYHLADLHNAATLTIQFSYMPTRKQIRMIIRDDGHGFEKSIAQTIFVSDNVPDIYENLQKIYRNTIAANGTLRVFTSNKGTRYILRKTLKKTNLDTRQFSILISSLHAHYFKFALHLSFVYPDTERKLSSCNFKSNEKWQWQSDELMSFAKVLQLEAEKYLQYLTRVDKKFTV